MTPLSGGVLLAASLLLPGMTMDKLANLGQGFMGLAGAGESVYWFSFDHLKGSLISIAIGALLYLVLGRGWMMRQVNAEEKEIACAEGNLQKLQAGKNSADGKRALQEGKVGIVSAFLKLRSGGTVYVDRWPKFLDLCKISGAVGKLLIKVGGVAAGLLDTFVDTWVVILRKTVYRDYSKMGELKEGNGFTYVLGSIANFVCRFMNRTFWRRHPRKTDYRHKLALEYWRIRETNYLITRSLSYGLILFSIGLCATLIYLLIGAVR